VSYLNILILFVEIRTAEAATQGSET